MAEYWRYADRMAPAQAPVKRMRAEFDELPPAGAGYYAREETRFDERDSRVMMREPESLGMGYGSGLTGADISGLTGGHLGGLGGLGATNLGLPSHDEHSFLGHSAGRMLGLDYGIGKPAALGINNGQPDYLPRQDSQGPPRPRVPLPHDASPTLFVEGLPSDCTRREAAHVFRPFYGFKEVRLVRKEGKRSGSSLVLCFVDFTDSQHAATAREALQGYKFDEMSQESEPLRLQFARTPGPRGGGRDEFHGNRDRDDFPRGGRPFRH